MILINIEIHFLLPADNSSQEDQIYCKPKPKTHENSYGENGPDLRNVEFKFR